jgi:hypothetical protein
VAVSPEKRNIVCGRRINGFVMIGKNNRTTEVTDDHASSADKSDHRRCPQRAFKKSENFIIASDTRKGVR